MPFSLLCSRLSLREACRQHPQRHSEISMAAIAWASKTWSALSFTWKDPISCCPPYSFHCGRKRERGGLKTSKSINCASKRTSWPSTKLMQSKELHCATRSSLTAWTCSEMLRMRQLIHWPIMSTESFSRDKFSCEGSIRPCVAIRTTYRYRSPDSSPRTPSLRLVSYDLRCQKRRDKDSG